MKTHFLVEPNLEFGAGKHPDIKFGLMNYGPFDLSATGEARRIRLGVVGTQRTIEGVLSWLERCKQGIPAKESKQPNLFPRFPGFGESSCFSASLVTESRWQRPIAQRHLDLVASLGGTTKAVQASADLFLPEIQYLAESTPADVLICAVPGSLLEIREEQKGFAGRAVSRDPHLDFHHLLKAKAMQFRKPIQIVLPSTYGERLKLRRKTGFRRTAQDRQVQDEATRAWNLHTAIYYKAGGIPWRLARDTTQLTTCYVGISFYKSLDQASVLTSVAQVFNERGDGVIVRGGQAELTKDDRQPHLSRPDAATILKDALKRYRAEHRTAPARVVIHKSSKFTSGEQEGFAEAVRSESIEVLDLICMNKALIRLFRCGPYPPLRGTLWSLDDASHVLYTRGSIDFYETYPGKYVPRPLLFTCQQTEQTPLFLGKEILGLTKMNWNNTQFDHSEPITLAAARNVGAILKYVPEGPPVHPHYSFYM
ncbi:MAG: hypothetical protein NT049_17295 [Planctomycetota bacterium]|nr:hypothetical protein [Planctomycetota bacterium]